LKAVNPCCGWSNPVLCPGDRLAWLEVNRVPVFDIDSNIVGILGTYQDITERREAEEALRSSKQVLQIVFDNIPQRVFFGKIAVLS
jgi:PAS domain-containing protein